MGIRVVTSATAPRTGFRFWRLVRFLLGWLLVIAGLIVTLLSAALIGVAMSQSSSGDLGTVLLLLAGGVVAVLFGRRLIRGKRQLVLFLRRFGFGGSSRALSFAVSTAVGRRFRTVTLDDAELAPVGTRRWMRWLLLAGSVAGLYALGAIVVTTFGWFSGDGMGNMFSDLAEDARAEAVSRGENAFNAIIVSVLTAIMLTMAVTLMFGAVMLVSFAIVGSSAVVSVSSFLGIIRAEFAKRTTVRRLDELAEVTANVAKRARRIFSPRLVVLSSAGDVWRDTVHKLAGLADILLIDVSLPSDNLNWEISSLKPDYRRRWVLIGDSERVAELVKDGGASTARAKELGALLDGEEVLVYTTTSRKALKDFSRALRATCENVQARTP